MGTCMAQFRRVNLPEGIPFCSAGHWYQIQGPAEGWGEGYQVGGTGSRRFRTATWAADALE